MLTIHYIMDAQRGHKEAVIMADEELRKEFAKRLNYYLERNGYNQADMARRMNVSTATTAKWCTGQTMPRVDKIQSLCNWLGVSKSDLLENDPEVSDDRPEYYFDPDARELAQFLYDNPDYKSLFEASRKVKREDIEFLKQMIDKITQ